MSNKQNDMDTVQVLFITDEEGSCSHLSVHRKVESAHREAAIFIGARTKEQLEDWQDTLQYWEPEAMVKLMGPDYKACAQERVAFWSGVQQLLSQEKIGEAINLLNSGDVNRIDISDYGVQ